MRTLETRGLSAGSLYKFLFIGLITPLFLFSLGCGIASYFGYSTVTFNNQQVYGLKGLVTGCVLGIVMPIIMAAVLWCLIGFGVWVWSRMKKITLTFKE